MTTIGCATPGYTDYRYNKVEEAVKAYARKSGMNQVMAYEAYLERPSDYKARYLRDIGYFTPEQCEQAIEIVEEQEGEFKVCSECKEVLEMSPQEWILFHERGSGYCLKCSDRIKREEEAWSR